MAGQFDTRFVEERFSMEDAEEGRAGQPLIAAILATLVAHRQTPAGLPDRPPRRARHEQLEMGRPLGTDAPMSDQPAAAVSSFSTGAEPTADG